MTIARVFELHLDPSEPDVAQSRKAAVDVEAAPVKKSFSAMKRPRARFPPGRPSRLSGTGAVTFASISGGMFGEDLGAREAGCDAMPVRMPKRASSFAQTTVIAATPALAAE